MAYQFVREPLLPEEADRLSHACQTVEEKLIVWTLLDTGMRINELCNLTSSNILWQQKCIRVSGKGGPYGKMTKKRVVPMSDRVRALLGNYFAINNKWFVKRRQAHNIIKEVANKSMINKEISAHVLRHTFSTLALMKGISLGALKKILGHDNLETTAIYLNFTDEHVALEYESKW